MAEPGVAELVACLRMGKASSLDLMVAGLATAAGLATVRPETAAGLATVAGSVPPEAVLLVLALVDRFQTFVVPSPVRTVAIVARRTANLGHSQAQSPLC